MIRITCFRGVGATVVPRAPKLKRGDGLAKSLHVYNTGRHMCIKMPKGHFGNETFNTLTARQLERTLQARFG